MNRRRAALSDLPVPARAYLLTVAGLGGSVLLWRAMQPWAFGTEQIVLLGLALLLGPRTVHLGMRVEMSGTLPLIFTSLMLNGQAAALDVSLVGMLSTCLIRRRPFETHRTVFNVSSILLTTLVGGQIYLNLNPQPEVLAVSAFLLPLTISVVAYYFMNTLMVAAAVGLSRGEPIPKLWRESFLWTSISYFAGGSMAMGMVLLIRSFGIYATAAAIPPVLLILYSYQLYLERMEERRKRIETVEKINVDLERMVQQRTTELRDVNRRLQESNQELQQANRLKSEFLANVSHELRTPLNAIIGFSELLQQGAYGSLNPEQSDFVGDIHDSGKHLLSLINDILDLSKIEAGKMTLTREEFHLPLLIRECITVIKPLALKKNITVDCEMDQAPEIAWADSGMIKQILYNLLSNAVKFTPDGGTIRAVCRSAGRDLIVSVADSGIGVPAEDQERIFSEFYQVDGSYARRYQGTGLGLALARRFVGMHGGEIGLESAPGKGSTFTFRIPDGARTPQPVEEEAPPARASEPSREHRHGTVLVVEDNPMNMKLTRSLLKNAGYEVLEARNEQEFHRQMRDRRPDLILMDVQLPGTDGLELTRRLKADPETAGIPTVALTAHAMKGDEERAFEAGCCGYIPKPVDPARFADQISSFMTTPVS